MRDNAVPCMNATLWQSRHGSHTTYNDDRICDACRVAASRFSRGRGSSEGERTSAPAPLATSAEPGSGLGSGSASSATAVSSDHGTASARSGGTFAGFLSGARHGERNHAVGSTALSAGRSVRRSRRIEWSPWRDVLAALRQL